MSGQDASNPVDPAFSDWKRRVSDFAASEVFDRLFREGMSLVEEAAAYLDGPGRIDSRTLSRELALVYAAESMEVTTRLMQSASWLVVQKAIREKDMKVEEAADEKFRLSEPTQPHVFDDVALPAELRALMARSQALYERIWRLDESLYSDSQPTGDNPVMKHLDRLRTAAEAGVFDPLSVWRDK
jgi:regulator of CtrA degradation